MNALNLKDTYQKYISFSTLREKDFIPGTVFWGSCTILFVLLNLNPEIFSRFISLFSKTLFRSELSANKVNLITNEIFVPVKGLLFLLTVLIILCPVVKSLWQSRQFWQRLELKRIALIALCVFLVLCLLVFPYAYPYGLNSHPFGLSALGIAYGSMSLDPFANSNVWVYRRPLQPAIAHFIQMDGLILYYFYSLICTYILTFLSILFLEFKVFQNAESKALNFKLRFLVYVSIATSSYLITSLLWVGYPDQLAFILILVMACIPMSPQSRLGLVVLSMAAHEGIAFALAPIILFCFPKREIGKAFLLIALYFGILLGIYASGLNRAISSEHLAVGGKTNLQIFLENPKLALAGLFFTYKLLWFVFLYTVWKLWQQKQRLTAVAILGIQLLPALMIPIALDTTRLVGFGFLGALIVASILINEYEMLKYQQYLFFSFIIVNILIPSHTVVLFYQDLLSTYPYPGVYRLIDSTFRSFF